MSAYYEWIGFAVYWSYIALMMGILCKAFMQASSYMLMLIIAAFRHRRLRLVRWSKVPLEFLAHWRDFTLNGAPDSLSSKYAEWRGIFNWKILPRSHNDHPY